MIVDAVAHRCRRGPMILIIDDMEWAPGPVVTTIAALTSALEGLALLVVLIVDPSGGGPAVAAIGRLDPEQARTLSVGPMSSADIAAIVVADGVEVDAVPPVVALADGRPGAARREAAAWAERTASDRLRAATVSSAGALAVAQQAQVSVLDEVVELVAACAAGTRCAAPRGSAASRTGRWRATGHKTPSCSSDVSAWSPNWPPGCSNDGSWSWSVRRAAASRRWCGPG